MSLRSLPFLLGLLCLVAVPAVVADDVMEDVTSYIRNIEIFQLRKSALACPVILVGQACPEENPLYYFKCCGDLASSCCFRLQDWVSVLMIVLAVCIVLSIIVNMIRCMCCY